MPNQNSRKRPEMSREPAFQFMAAATHLFCACFNFTAFVYHLRRTHRVQNSED